MANITLAGTLRDPNGDLAVGDKIRFTHKSTTGETVKSASSILTIDPTGVYSVDLEYGLILVEYKDARNSQFKNLGVATVNGTNPATTIPELLNALVPVSSAELIEFQAILADCVAAKDAAEAAAATLDLINDLSQAYIFDTVALFKASSIEFPDGKTIHLSDRGADFIKSSAVGLGNDANIIDNTAATASVKLVTTNGIYIMSQWGFDSTGVTDETARMITVSDQIGRGGVFRFGAGTYKFDHVLTNAQSIIGEGRDNTYLIPFNTAGNHILISAEGNNNDERFQTIQDLTMTGYLPLTTTRSTGNGIVFGTLTDTVQYAYIKNVVLIGYAENLLNESIVGIRMENVMSERSNSGFKMPTAKILTVGNFVDCQFRLNDRGLNIEGGSLLKFTTCVIESNSDIGAFISNRSNSGARSINFDTCWFEKNGIAPLTAIPCELYIDAFPGTERRSNLTFDNCIFSPSDQPNIPCVRLVRGNSVVFTKCEFTAMTIAYFKVTVGSDLAEAMLVNCSTTLDRPSPSIYSAMPTRILSNGMMFGFSYEYDYNGQRYSNFENQTIELSNGVFDNVNVRGVSVIKAKTLFGNVDIQSLDGGIEGQIIQVAKTSSGNVMTLQNASGVGQQITTATGANPSLSVFGTASLSFIEGFWYSSI